MVNDRPISHPSSYFIPSSLPRATGTLPQASGPPEKSSPSASLPNPHISTQRTHPIFLTRAIHYVCGAIVQPFCGLSRLLDIECVLVPGLRGYQTRRAKSRRDSFSENSPSHTPSNPPTTTQRLPQQNTNLGEKYRCLSTYARPTWIYRNNTSEGR
jgi:hypothetical protein